MYYIFNFYTILESEKLHGDAYPHLIQQITFHCKINICHVVKSTSPVSLWKGEAQALDSDDGGKYVREIHATAWIFIWVWNQKPKNVLNLTKSCSKKPKYRVKNYLLTTPDCKRRKFHSFPLNCSPSSLLQKQKFACTLHSSLPRAFIPLPSNVLSDLQEKKLSGRNDGLRVSTIQHLQYFNIYLVAEVSLRPVRFSFL